MADSREGFSLRRWSARKLEAAREARGAEAQPEGSRDVSAREGMSLPPDAVALEHRQRVPHPAIEEKQGHVQAQDAEGDTSAATRARPYATAAVASSPTSPASAPEAAAGPPLPSLDALSIDSDYSPFMQAGVDDSVKRSALKKLFSDPRFNVMDGLDVYIDDYSKPDPIAPDIVRTLVQARYIFDPPATRVNEQGYVEDLPKPTAEDEGNESERAEASASSACSTPPEEAATPDAENVAPADEHERETEATHDEPR